MIYIYQLVSGDKSTAQKLPYRYNKISAAISTGYANRPSSGLLPPPSCSSIDAFCASEEGVSPAADDAAAAAAILRLFSLNCVMCDRRLMVVTQLRSQQSSEWPDT